MSIHGLKYKVGATLHIGQTEDELPIFWEVIKIVILNKYVRDIMFVVSAKETFHFHNHFQCYKVVKLANPQIKVAYFKDFSCVIPLSQHKPPGLVHTCRRLVCTRYDLEL